MYKLLYYMEEFEHNMSNLFAQLGLPTVEKEIDLFIELHSPIAPDVPLDQASFWNESQAQFLREAISEDSDWSEMVDQLDARLRNK